MVSLAPDDIVIHTADNIVYHTFLHDNATMHCDTDHETSLQWYFSINNSLITLEGKYTMQGSNLVVRDVTPHEAMGYACRILNPANNPLVIYSSIKVYGECSCKLCNLMIIIIVIFSSTQYHTVWSPVSRGGAVRVNTLLFIWYTQTNAHLDTRE